MKWHILWRIPQPWPKPEETGSVVVEAESKLAAYARAQELAPAGSVVHSAWREEADSAGQD